MDLRALILAAGRGTRLGEAARDLPKPLLPAGGRPLIGWIIMNLRRAGITRLAVNVHHQAGALVDWLGDGRRHGLDELVISREAELLGTAGALRPLRAWLGRSPFIVHYGDVVTDHDLAALEGVRAGAGAEAAILVHRRRGSNSIVELAPDGRVTAFRERPPADQVAAAGECWVNSGVAACAPALLARLPASGPADLPRDCFPALVAAGTLRAAPLAGYRLAVDSPERLAALDADIRAGRLALAETAARS